MEERNVDLAPRLEEEVLGSESSRVTVALPTRSSSK
jgi:hypothetical protein